MQHSEVRAGDLPWVGRGEEFMYKSLVVRCERCSRGNRQSQFKCWIVGGGVWGRRHHTSVISSSSSASSSSSSSDVRSGSSDCDRHLGQLQTNR